MRNTRYQIRTAVILYMVFFFLPLPAGSANSLPSAEDINSLAEQVKLIGDAFIRASFQLRMQYEYSGQSLPQDNKEKLHKLAKSASDKLQTIIKEQETLKQQIEDYQGDDWDIRYGSTGLWRKSAGDLYKTIFSKCEIDYYLALAIEQPLRNEILHNILAQIDSTFSHVLSGAVRLLRIKTLVLLAETESEYKAQARDAVNSPDMIYPGMPCEFDIRRQIQKIKFSGKIRPDQINKLTDYFCKIDCVDDFELILSLEILQLQSKQFEAFEKTVSLWPQTEDILGSLILSDLSGRAAQGQLNKLTLRRISVFEAELAAQAAWKDQAKDCTALLEVLSNTERFRTPLILYVAAVSFADSSPIKAIDLLIEASKLQQMQKSDRLNIEAYKIAGQAAQLSYNLLAGDSPSCPLAIKAFENYHIIAGEKIYEELEYLYSVVLSNCGQIEEGKKLLETIADRPGGRWRHKARSELIVMAVQQKEYENPNQKSKLLRQFSSLIADSNDCQYAGEAMELLAEFIDRIDQIQADSGDFIGVAQDCKKLAEFHYSCLNDHTSGLYLAEVAVFAANKEEEKLLEVEKLLDSLDKNGLSVDVDFLRCQARLLGQQGKLDGAARLWGKICKVRRNDTPSANQRSWKWWRAKFYELGCWAKQPQSSKKDALHTIEVLENSFDDIPPLWAEKLSLLKQQCRSR